MQETTETTKLEPPPSTADVIDAVRKPNLKDMSGLSVMRLLAPFHDGCTRLLLRLPINARQVTVVWFALSLGSFVLSGMGQPWAFVVGAVLYYAAIILDLSDGEIGRYQGQFMTHEQNFVTHVNGMYLDRICHTMATPLWPLAMTVGLYQLTDRWPILAVGTGMIVYQCVRRALPMLRAYLAEHFRQQAADLMEQGVLQEFREPAASKATLLSRVFDKIDFWIGNGKRLNLIVLLAAIADCIVSAADAASPLVLYYAYFSCGIAATLWLPYGLTRLLVTKDLVAGICRETSGHDHRTI